MIEPLGKLALMRGDTLLRLRNATCPYCGTDLNEVLSDEDHVIGRRFVPKGTLAGSWNLAVRACVKHNNAKSSLEDDLSAITMQPDGLGRHPTADLILKSEAARKSRSVSRRTRKPVAASVESLQLDIAMAPGLSLTANIWAPPQADTNRIFELARFQLSALFYMITYSEDTRRGRFWRDHFSPFNEAIRSDWGNSLQVGFAHAVSSWPVQLGICAAEGFFRALIRRCPEAYCWAWALEWNKSRRIVGMFGDYSTTKNVAITLDAPQMETVMREGSQTLAVRIETLLSEADDILFSVADHELPQEAGNA